MLGANGNGKTTLIKLLVGVLRPLSGRILINGKEPGSKGVNVPGRMVGYMPQETALYTNLTIEQVFNYYGYIFGMSNKQIEERIRYLYANMDLKEKHKNIGTLSGGQQRSVSMALTLIHSPELVIWDEPTVGLDPIKRDRMWRFLFDMCRNQGNQWLIGSLSLLRIRLHRIRWLISFDHTLCRNKIIQQYNSIFTFTLYQQSELKKSDSMK